MTGNTVRLHRVFLAPPKRIYKAYTDSDAMAKWLPPNGFTGRVMENDIRVGGSYQMYFTNLETRKSESFGGTYIELVPDQRIVVTDRFDDPNLPGEMTTTVELKAVSVGTEVSIVQEGIPEVIPLEACYIGWQQSLALLALLVEAEVSE